ncbi:hypothetical protein ABK040_013384 [Willaertia magna]
MRFKDYIQSDFVQFASIGDERTVIDMIESGTNVNSFDNVTFTALMTSSYFGHINIVRLLLNQPTIIVNQENKDGNTALHFACMSNQLLIVKLLLNFGANKDIVNNKGELPIDLTTNLEIVNCIKNCQLKKQIKNNRRNKMDIEMIQKRKKLYNLMDCENCFSNNNINNTLTNNNQLLMTSSNNFSIIQNNNFNTCVFNDECGNNDKKRKRNNRGCDESEEFQQQSEINFEPFNKTIKF